MAYEEGLFVKGRFWPYLLTLACLLGGLAAPWFSTPSAGQSEPEGAFIPDNLDYSGVPGVFGDQPSLKKMIGQMLLVGFFGTSPNHAGSKTIARQLRDGKIGGVIFMSRNIRSRQQVRRLTAFFRKGVMPLPPIISVDQEGGAVQRLAANKGFARYPTARKVALRYSLDKAYEVYKAMAWELREHGFNLNFGPVIDLNRNPKNPIIGRKGRSFGTDPKQATAYAQAFITAHREAGVLTSAKHFPGHGSSWADSHKRFVDLSKSWEISELTPYRTLASRSKLDTVMIGHLYHPLFDEGNKAPASLSRRAISEVLRRKIGFDGVVITDDMEMAAVKKRYSFKESILRAVEAGNDILLMSSSQKANFSQPAQVTRIIVDAVRQGRIKAKRISNAYRRIISLKKRLTKYAKRRETKATDMPLPGDIY